MILSKYNKARTHTSYFTITKPFGDKNDPTDTNDPTDINDSTDTNDPTDTNASMDRNVLTDTNDPTDTNNSKVNGLNPGVSVVCVV